MKINTWMALIALAALLAACSDDEMKKQADMTTTADKAVTTDSSPDTTVADDQAAPDQASADQTLDLPPADKGAGDGGAACGKITVTGCCDGTTLKYCEKGVLKTMDCSKSPKCGWDTSFSYYDCGTSGASDPSGKFPKSCSATPPDLGPTPDAGATDAKASDSGGSTACGGVSYEGCCNGSVLWYCDSGTLKSLSCSKSPKCGWDSSGKYYDCGTSGGADPAGKHPKACKSVPDFGLPPDTGATDAKAPDSGGSTGCGSVSYEGCCDGTTLKYCDSGKLETLDCTKSPKCGWDSSGKYYDCGTSGGADPAGKHPKACKSGSSDAGVKDSGPAPDAKAGDAKVADSKTPADSAVTTGGVVITEMLINPKAKADSKAEWFELYNGGSTSVSLKGWSITDQPGSSQNKHTITAALVIKPGAYVVLGKFYDKTTNGGVTVNYAYGKSVWDLGNGGDEIYLYDASKKLVDKVAYTKSWTIPNGASLSLKSPALDNSLSKNWCAEKTKWCSTCDMGTPGKKAGCK